MRAQFILEKNDSLKGMIYAEGHALNAEAAELCTKKYSAKTACKFSAYTYQRITHNSCPFNEKKPKLK